jgi:deoxyribodipyrimidine photo-lyase
MLVNPKRVRVLCKKEHKKGPVIYWMSRDQRTMDNWAILFSQGLALKFNAPLAVIFCLVPEFLGASLRQYRFMLQGLKEVELKLKSLGIPFILLQGRPELEIPKFIQEQKAGILVADFSPLRISQKWKKDISDKINIPFYEVDAHNIVPCWVASDKQEYAAYTFRPKIRRLLPEFLDDCPVLKANKMSWKEDINNDWQGAERKFKFMKTLKSVPEREWIRAGEDSADNQLTDFIDNRLSRYDIDRNNPIKDGQSDLSPYLHFGQISAERVSLKVLASNIESDAFLDELIVRRELSDNFCYYSSNYDSTMGFPDWARKSLESHRQDTREYIYSQDELEQAKTHDPLWNAAQREMVLRGKMHGFLRMYWAKKILEWTPSPEDAIKIAIYLNDRYELDGRDPNGYTGIAWSIGGVHDRAWKERPVFGKIRYMSYKGASSKFDVMAYIKKFQNID